jgi:hypothetical protein
MSMPGSVGSVSQGKDRQFKITLKFESRISFYDLQNALQGSSVNVPFNAVQALDVIFRHLPSMKYVQPIENFDKKLN